MEFAALTPSAAPAAGADAYTETANGDHRKWRMFGEDGFSFGDLVDIVNPLHHIPVVGTLYRKVTGDDIAALPRVAGGTLFGGAIGLAASLVSVASKVANGKDITETVVDRVAQVLGFGNNDQDIESAETEIATHIEPAPHPAARPDTPPPELSPAALERLADTFGQSLSFENTYALNPALNPHALQAHHQIWDRLSHADSAYRSAPPTAPVLHRPDTAQNLDTDA